MGLTALLFLFLLTITVEWPQAGGPKRDFVYSAPALSRDWPKEGPPTVWQRALGAGFSGPVVCSNKVITFHRTNNSEIVEALNAATGKPVWTFSYPTAYEDDFGFDPGPRATPVCGGNLLITLGAEGKLHCLDLENGARKWMIDLRQRFGAAKGFFGIAASPWIEGQHVYLNAGGKKSAGIVVLDLRTGDVIATMTDQEASYSSPVGADIKGQRHVLIFTREGLVDIDPANHGVRFFWPWRPKMQASVNAAIPVVAGSRVFISASYGAGAAVLDLEKMPPQVVWSGDDILSNHYTTSVHHRGKLYGFDGRQEQGPRLRCVDFLTGKVHWTREGLGAGNIIVADDRLLVLTERGELLLISADPEKFEVLSRAQVLGSEVRAYPALSEGRFYARDKTRLICLDCGPSISSRK